MPQRKSIFEVRYRTLPGTILNSLVVLMLYITSVAMSSSHSTVAPSLSPLGEQVSQWGKSLPVVSYIILFFVVLYISISLAQIASRLRLYGVSTHLPIEMFPILLLMIGSRGDVAVGVVEMLLLLNAIKNMFGSYRATNSSGTLSLGALSLGAMPLLYPSAVVLWIVIPPLLVMFDRTLREVIVTIFSLIIPLFAYLYILWMQGGCYAEELSNFGELVIKAEGAHLFHSMSVVEIVACAIVGVVLILSTVALYQLDNTVKARRRLVMCSLFAYACCIMAILPSSGRLSLWILALPMAILSPVVMLRLGRRVSFGLYILLLIVGVASAFFWIIAAFFEIFF